jgi:hypothetical protein
MGLRRAHALRQVRRNPLEIGEIPRIDRFGLNLARATKKQRVVDALACQTLAGRISLAGNKSPRVAAYDTGLCSLPR